MVIKREASMLLFCFLVVSLLQIQHLNAMALRKIRAGDSHCSPALSFVLQAVEKIIELC
jgi:hypothetical protein